MKPNKKGATASPEDTRVWSIFRGKLRIYTVTSFDLIEVSILCNLLTGKIKSAQSRRHKIVCKRRQDPCPRNASDWTIVRCKLKIHRPTSIDLDTLTAILATLTEKTEAAMTRRREAREQKKRELECDLNFFQMLYAADQLHKIFPEIVLELKRRAQDGKDQA